MVELVGSLQGLVDPLHDGRDRVDRVQRLIRIHGLSQVRVACDLPAGKVNGLETGLDLLHGHVAGQCPQGVDERLLMKVAPQLGGAFGSQAVFDLGRAT